MSIVQFGLLLTFGAPFVVAIWIAFTHRQRTSASDGTSFRDAGGFSGRLKSVAVDIEAAVKDAATATGPLARAHWVKLDLAVSPSMRVHADPNVLGTALRETMMAAIRATPGGQVLVTAANVGRQLHIRIADDGRGDDQPRRESLVRDAGALVVLQGGSLGVHATPGRGTTVTVRLPMLGGEREAIDGLRELADQAARVGSAIRFTARDDLVSMLASML